MAFTVTWIFPKYGWWLFHVFLISIWYSCYLDIPIINLRCVKLSVTWDKVPYHICGGGHLLNHVGATSKNSHLMDLLFPVILSHVITIVSVWLNIINITWGWEKLNGWLVFVGWVSWIHIFSTAGDDSARYHSIQPMELPVSYFLLPS